MKILQKIILVTGLLMVVSCTKEGTADNNSAPGGTGTGGSLARFTIAANHLYLADQSSLVVFELSDPANPVRKTEIQIGFGVETIFPYQDKLFIGSNTGMFIFSIANPSTPVKLGEARHVRSCDPVVANGNTAYVTLRGSGTCGPAEDGLYIYDVSNVLSPALKSLLRLSTPAGLGIKDTVVFVCRGNAGLTLVNVRSSQTPRVMYTIAEGNYQDVIPFDDLLICYVASGILIYDISNLDQIVKIGTISN